MNLERLEADLCDSRAGEGFRAYPYRDPRGFLTVGHGINLDAGITAAESLAIVRMRLTGLAASLSARLPWFNSLDDVRQRVLVELAYNMGVRGLLCFVKMLAAIEAEDFAIAHHELLDSAWATQVQGARRDRLASMLLTGTELT